MVKTRLQSLVSASALLTMLCLLVPQSQAAVPVNTHTFEAEVTGVRASNVNGHHRLLLEIDEITGPTGCKSSSIIVASEQHSPHAQAEIEALALQALLNSESILVSVPTDRSHCVDGKPLATDLRLLGQPASFNDPRYQELY